jgi:hypothetical protein
MKPRAPRRCPAYRRGVSCCATAFALATLAHPSRRRGALTGGDEKGHRGETRRYGDARDRAPCVRREVCGRCIRCGAKRGRRMRHHGRGVGCAVTYDIPLRPTTRPLRSPHAPHATHLHHGWRHRRRGLGGRGRVRGLAHPRLPDARHGGALAGGARPLCRRRPRLPRRNGRLVGWTPTRCPPCWATWSAPSPHSASARGELKLACLLDQRACALLLARSWAPWASVTRARAQVLNAALQRNVSTTRRCTTSPSPRVARSPRRGGDSYPSRPARRRRA